jgi:hypothetical protein
VAESEIVTVPYAPRHAFLPLHVRDARWAVVVAHRRAGKTVACINELIRAAALSEPREAAPPRFAYVAPQLVQAKDIAWNYLLEYTACFGPRRRASASELWVEIPDNGARIRLYGADNGERLRGLYFDGVVVDEMGDMAPETWSKVIRPTLSDWDGWAIFIGTPKGRNDFHRLWTEAEADPEWFTLMLKASATRLLGPKELADARKHMTDDEYAQEYECSFDAAVRGTYYAKELNALEAAGQISSVPHDPNLKVHTAWDLGIADSTVIWFLQVRGRETRVIDVLKGEGEALAWYAKALEERPALHGHAGNWIWGNHYLPHDAEARDLTSGKSSVETLAALGIRATIVPKLEVQDGIQALRALLPMCWFDAARCQAGIAALKEYRRDYDAKRQELRAGPRHDWTSHYADALRYFAVGHREGPPGSREPPRRPTGWIA